MQQTITRQKTILTDCPTCSKSSEFHHIGEQKWSEAVAKKLNLPQIINLYECAHCHTTLTDIQLKPQD